MSDSNGTFPLSSAIVVAEKDINLVSPNWISDERYNAHNLERIMVKEAQSEMGSCKEGPEKWVITAMTLALKDKLTARGMVPNPRGSQHTWTCKETGYERTRWL